MSDSFTPTWRGCTDAWECDVMGHMNVQFYGQKFDAAAAMVLAELGLGPGTVATAGIAPRRQIEHIAFKRECRAGAPLHAETAVLAVDAQGGTIRIGTRLIHSAGGVLSATDDCLIGGFETGSNSRRPLPDWVLEAAGRRLAAPSAVGFPEEIPRPAPADAASDQEADRLALPETLRNLIQESDLGPGGGLTRQGFIARVSGAAAHLLGGGAGAEASLREAGLGTAALDYRIRWIAPVRYGQPVVFRSGVGGTAGKTMRFFHWMLDARSGKALATIEIVAVFFDLALRKAVPLPDGAAMALARHRVPWPPG